MTSPSPAVDAFLAVLIHPHLDDLLALRADLLALPVDGLDEGVKWNAPSYAVAGQDRLTFRLFPGGAFQLILHRGAKVKDATGFSFDDPASLARWASPDRGIVDLSALDLTSQRADLFDLAERWLRS